MRTAYNPKRWNAVQTSRGVITFSFKRAASPEPVIPEEKVKAEPAPEIPKAEPEQRKGIYWKKFPRDAVRCE